MNRSAKDSMCDSSSLQLLDKKEQPSNSRVWCSSPVRKSYSSPCNRTIRSSSPLDSTHDSSLLQQLNEKVSKGVKDTEPLSKKSCVNNTGGVSTCSSLKSDILLKDVVFTIQTMNKEKVDLPFTPHDSINLKTLSLSSFSDEVFLDFLQWMVSHVGKHIPDDMIVAMCSCVDQGRLKFCRLESQTSIHQLLL